MKFVGFSSCFASCFASESASRSQWIAATDGGSRKARIDGGSSAGACPCGMLAVHAPAPGSRGMNRKH
ncbi:hypothetical protein, partial [Burkholderia sp. Cy-647]|uniref:hypothetical protein n=1 Tax=Burkholderia sp. Cy-647 TaxID=2608328 RepID=UPI0019629762